jgi:hypothetical protein
MRDFPVFTTENGVGSLVLKEIPYRGVAYITICDSACPNDFLQECVEFCRAVGAECVYARGHAILERYPLYTIVLRMTGNMAAIDETDAHLFPVTEKTVDRWREIYNKRMECVDNASYMSEAMGKELLTTGDAYFIHRNGELLGIGKAAGNRIDCVASVKPGSGREVVSALVHGLLSEPIELEVASTNTRAIRLYESMGFLKIAEISRWYKIF